MCNKFSYLRRSPNERFGRRTARSLKTYETIRVCEVGHNYVEVLLGRYKGVWVAGYNYSVGTLGGYASPSVKLGWFDSRQDAELYMLGELLNWLEPYGLIRRAICERIFKVRQMELKF
ncbi:MAG: hypothetical protein IKB97_02545 [Bacteroidaceae bacterium]|nr:hypothetical protein [Bacteroidaceae bacterium]